LDYISERLKKIREYIDKNGIDAVLITKRENITWLSGFSGTSAWLVLSREESVLITDFRYEEQAARQAPLFNVRIFKGDPCNAIKELIDRFDIRKLGFEEYHVTCEQYSEYTNKLDPVEMVPLGGLIQKLREIKDPEEISFVKKAVAIADKAFSRILDYIRPGVTELEIAAELEYFMRKEGSSAPSFETIVASGLRSSMPHGLASEKKIAPGDPVTMDFGATYSGYCSDLTRTVFVGQPSDELRKIYGIVLEAQLKAEEALRAGLYGKDIDSVARKIISDYGYGDCFGHGLGHGVGKEIHEEPRLSPSGLKKLEPGMIVTIEPGIYDNKIGGVRIEDMAVVTENGAEILTRSPKQMIVL